MESRYDYPTISGLSFQPPENSIPAILKTAIPHFINANSVVMLLENHGRIQILQFPVAAVFARLVPGCSEVSFRLSSYQQTSFQPPENFIPAILEIAVHHFINANNIDRLGF